MRAWEIILSDAAFPERTFRLQEGALLLGSSPECAIATNAPGVAPRHAEFLASEGRLQVRCLEGGASVRINGAPVDGLVTLDCPATLEIGSLKISVKEAAEHAPSQPASDSTLRLVHPAHKRAAQVPKSDGFDALDPIEVTGRIVYQLPRAGEAAKGPAFSADTGVPPELAAASFSAESTMAFSMEDLEISISDKVPVRMDYEVKSEIARGGMGKIYCAEDAELERLVALKVSTAGDRGKDSPFFREAKVLAALAHPNIVPIHNLGVDEAGRPFYSMKLIQGRTLQWIIKQLAARDAETKAVYTLQRLLDIFRKVCDAVSFAHAKGFLHRDLKPENIMVGEFGEVLVMDWGLAKALRRSRTGAETQASEEPSEAPEPDTLPYIEGTPQYMSPEQANGVYGGLDERSDIYSLGGILYAILTLRPPVSGSSLNEVLEKVRSGETTTMALPLGSVKPESPARSAKSAPEALRAVTLKALSKERDRRYQRVGELAKDIEAYLGGFATQAEGAGLARHMVLLVKRHRLASALAGVALIGALVFMARLAQSEQKASANALRAEQEAARATANADEAKRNAARAEEEARIAAQNEQRAKQEKEVARRAQARTQIALAEAAEQVQNAEAMQQVLDNVPEDLRDQPWRYLSGLTDSAEVTIENKAPSGWHKFEPHPLDPDLLFTLHDDGWIRTVNLNTGAMQDVLKTNHGHRTLSRLEISPDARSVALTALRDKRMQVDVLDLNTGEWRAGFELPYTTRPPYFKFSKAGEALLVSIPGTGEAYVLDVIKNTLRWPFEPNKPGLAYFSENEKAVVYLPAAKPPIEFDAVSGTVIRQPEKDGFKINIPSYEFYALTPDRTKVYGLITGALRMFEVDSGKKQFDERLPAGSERMGRLSLFAKEGRLVTLSAASDGAGVLLVHDAIDGKVLQSRLIAMKKNVGIDWTLVTHPLSKRIIVARGESLKVWSIPPPAETLKISFHTSSMKDGFWFSGNPATAHFLKLARRVPAEKTELQLARTNLGKAQGDTPRDTLTIVMDRDTHPSAHVSTNAAGDLVGIQFLLDNTLFIFRERNNTLDEVNRFEVPGHSTLVAMSPTGRLVWSQSGAFDTASGKRLQKLNRKNLSEPPEGIPPVWLGESHVAEVLLRKNSGDQNTGDLDRSIVLWSAGADDPAAMTPAPEANALAASPDGSRIAEAGRDMRVRLRDGKTLGVVKTLRVHDGPVVGVAWHPTLPLLATASEDHSVRIWDMRTDGLLEEFRSTRNLPILRLKWSPDGRFLGVSYMTSADNLKIYEPKACQEATPHSR